MLPKESCYLLYLFSRVWIRQPGTKIQQHFRFLPFSPGYPSHFQCRGSLTFTMTSTPPSPRQTLLSSFVSLSQDVRELSPPLGMKSWILPQKDVIWLGGPGCKHPALVLSLTVFSVQVSCTRNPPSETLQCILVSDFYLLYLPWGRTLRLISLAERSRAECGFVSVGRYYFLTTLIMRFKIACQSILGICPVESDPCQKQLPQNLYLFLTKGSVLVSTFSSWKLNKTQCKIIMWCLLSLSVCVHIMHSVTWHLRSDWLAHLQCHECIACHRMCSMIHHVHTD